MNSGVRTGAADRPAVAIGAGTEAAAQKLAAAAVAEREATASARTDSSDAARSFGCASSQRERVGARAVSTKPALAVLREVAGNARNKASFDGSTTWPRCPAAAVVARGKRRDGLNAVSHPCYILRRRQTSCAKS